MKKFMVLYRAPIQEFKEMMAKSTPEQQKAGMDEWRTWMDANKNFFVDGGSPLGKTKRVDTSGATDSANDIGGYSIVQAESADEAAKILSSSPHLKMSPGAWTEISEIMSM